MTEGVKITQAHVNTAFMAFSHVKKRYDSALREYRIAYRGLKPDREEAMAEYISVDQCDPQESYLDVIAAGRRMQNDFDLMVFEADKLRRAG